MVLLANLIHSAHAGALSEFSAFGSRLVLIATDIRPSDAGASPPTPINSDDIDALRRSVTGLEGVVTLFAVGTDVRACGRRLPTTLVGVVPQQERLAGWHLADGRLITPPDVSLANNVAVLGAHLAEQLTCVRGPIRHITVNGKPFEVVGVLREQPSLQVRADDVDRAVMAPYTVAERMFARGRTAPIGALALVNGEAELSTTVTAIRNVLRQRHRLYGSDSDDFRLQTQEDLTTLARQLAERLKGVMLVVTCWSMLIAGIGVMNSIYTSVIERTMEIGLRRSVGATRQAIVTEFLSAGLLTAVAGAVAGIAMAIAISALVVIAMDLPFRVDVAVVGLALVSSILLGLVAAAWPAARAGQLAPYEAVRHE